MISLCVCPATRGWVTRLHAIFPMETLSSSVQKKKVEDNPLLLPSPHSVLFVSSISSLLFLLHLGQVDTSSHLLAILHVHLHILLTATPTCFPIFILCLPLQAYLSCSVPWVPDLVSFFLARLFTVLPPFTYLHLVRQIYFYIRKTEGNTCRHFSSM